MKKHIRHAIVYYGIGDIVIHNIINVTYRFKLTINNIERQLRTKLNTDIQVISIYFI